MPKGYWIGRVDVEDADRYPEYIKTATPAYQQYGAKFLVRGGTVHETEGTSRARNVVIEFPTIEAAIQCYNSDIYAKARAIRQSVSEGEIIVVEGAE